MGESGSSAGLHRRSKRGAVKVVGGLYLIYLGVTSLRSARHAPNLANPAVRLEKQLFAEAFVINLLNPKVAIFFLAFLPQFVERGHGAIWSQTLILGVVYIMLGLGGAFQLYTTVMVGVHDRRQRCASVPNRRTRPDAR